MKNIREKAYAKYQLDWMNTHDFGISDLIRIIDEIWDGNKGKQTNSPIANFNYFIHHSGFNGEWWACFGEFLENEYLERDYMETLLNKSEYELYLTDIKNLQE